jgi:hypothetical protein
MPFSCTGDAQHTSSSSPSRILASPIDCSCWTLSTYGHQTLVRGPRRFGVHAWLIWWNFEDYQVVVGSWEAFHPEDADRVPDTMQQGLLKPLMMADLRRY